MSINSCAYWPDWLSFILSFCVTVNMWYVALKSLHLSLFNSAETLSFVVWYQKSFYSSNKNSISVNLLAGVGFITLKTSNFKNSWYWLLCTYIKTKALVGWPDKTGAALSAASYSCLGSIPWFQSFGWNQRYLSLALWSLFCVCKQHKVYKENQYLCFALVIKSIV